MKNKIKSLLAITIACTLTVSNAYASSGTVVSTQDGGTSTIGGSYYGGQASYWKLSNGDTVFCVDPGKSVPAVGQTYKEASWPSETLHAQFATLCSNKKFQNLSSDVDAYSTIIKALSVKSGLGSDGSGGVYKAFLEGKNTTWKNTSITDSEVRAILKEASDGKTSSTDHVKVTNPTKNVFKITTDVEVKLSVSNSNYIIVVDGSSTGQSATLNPNGSSKNYTIKIQNSDSTKTDCIENVDVEIKYDKQYGSSSGTTADAKYYVLDSKSSSSTPQRGITCVNGNGDTTCDLDASKENCVKKVTINSCDVPEPPKCPDPEVKVNNGDKNAEGLCDRTGNTVVSVKETPNTVSASETDIACISDEEHDATKVILGDNDNSYCHIYCTENYELHLPGPDSTNDDPANADMFINAGTYFNITGDMFDTDTITCYSVTNFNKYQTDMYNSRKNLIDAYNAYAELKGEANATRTSDENFCYIKGSYQKLEIDTNGKVSSTTVAINDTKPVSNCAVSSSDFQDAIEDANKKFLSKYDETSKIITDAQAEWNECLNWNMDNINEVLKSECNVDIEFSYAESECGKYKLVQDGEKQITENASGTSSTAGNATIYVGVSKTGNVGEMNKTISTISGKFVSKSENVRTNYKFENAFTVNLETGDVSCDAQTGDNYSDVYYGFPISTKAQQAKYPYQFTYEGVGLSFKQMESKTCERGRFDSLIKDDKSFTCYFDVNSCDECEVACVGDTPDGCEIAFNECDGECKVACVGGGCIVDFNGGLLTTYRTLSLNDPFPNETAMMISNNPARMLAYTSTKDGNKSFSNWNTTKGKETKDNIIKDGEQIYDEKPEYSITLTPKDINEIRKYNKKAENDGEGYLNKTLTCKNNGFNYGQCTSDFVQDRFIINPIEDADVTVGKTTFKTYNGAEEPFTGPAWK